MLHQTLTPPFFQFPFPPSSSSSSSITPPPAAGFLHAALSSVPTTAPYFRSSQVEREEAKMESVEVTALKNGCRREASPVTQQGLLAEDAGWAAERGNLLGEEFSVDDLLDFGGLEAGKEEEEEEEAKAEAFEVENSNSSSSSSSALSFEPPPPSDIILPAHDAAELEWVSRIMEETEFQPSLGVAPHRPASQNQTLTQTHKESQPVNPRASTPPQPKPLCSLSTEAVVPVKAKRSKRSRTTGGAWPTFSAVTFADSSASTTTTSSSSSCSSSPSYYSCLIYNNATFFLDGNPAQPKKHQPKKRGRKPKHPLLPAAGGGGGLGERRCSHCGTQKTPQWRAGPMGSKTLCNACGVRFKSGRLLPEYRPACSPTFMSHVHSNSHRKVLEMRRKKEDQVLVASAPPVPTF